MEESGNVELIVISHINCLGKKKLQPRKCVFLVMASRAPSNQAHVPFCGVYPYNPINRSCSSSKKTKNKTYNIVNLVPNMILHFQCCST